jgi:2'-5' RNA ligase
VDDATRTALDAAAETAVVVLLPEADPAVDEHRLRLDHARPWGVPAHLTVLYPFVPPAEVDDVVLAALADAVRAIPPFDCVFADTAWFGADVLWLAPADDGPFRALIRAVSAAFPDHPPYGGAHGAEPVPHLTVAERVLADDARMRVAEASVRERLPVRAHVGSVALIAGRRAPDSWSVIATVPLGGRAWPPP